MSNAAEMDAQEIINYIATVCRCAPWQMTREPHLPML